jgi:hypothetical protein
MIVELIFIGGGLGLTMLTLLIASQHAVPRAQLGITTSLNQFSRTIGGALGVALLGAMLAAGLAEFSHDPNALVNPEARAHIPAVELVALQGALEKTLRTIFWACTVVVGAALAVAAIAMPEGKIGSAHSENMVMAEMTTIDAKFGVRQPQLPLSRGDRSRRNAARGKRRLRPPHSIVTSALRELRGAAPTRSRCRPTVPRRRRSSTSFRNLARGRRASDSRRGHWAGLYASRS